MEGLCLDTSMKLFMELAKREASKIIQKLGAVKGLVSYVKVFDLISRTMKCQRRTLRSDKKMYLMIIKVIRTATECFLR